MKKQKLLVPVSCVLLAISLLNGMRNMDEPMIVEAREYVHLARREDFKIQIEENVVIEEVKKEYKEPVIAPVYYEISLSNDEQDLIRKISADFGIDFEVVLAICKTESGFDQFCIGDNGESYGIMQIQPRWWTGFFNDHGCTDWLSITDNVTVGCSILRYLYDSYGDTRSVLNAYNSSNPNYNNGYADRVLENMYSLEKR